MLKKTTIFIAVAFTVYLYGAFTVDAAVTQKPPTNQGLVGYWNMNEGTSTVAHD